VSLTRQLKNKAPRQPWSAYFLTLAQQIATRATCPRAKVGCVLTFENRIIAAGFNGSPSGWEHCEDEGCLIVNERCVRTVHAERNAICQAARHGVSVEGCKAYITLPPCLTCYLSLASAGIVEIVIPMDAKPRSEDEWYLIGEWCKNQARAPSIRRVTLSDPNLT
jgi:dCMP deaminase